MPTQFSQNRTFVSRYEKTLNISYPFNGKSFLEFCHHLRTLQHNFIDEICWLIDLDNHRKVEWLKKKVISQYYILM
jgi:hypothetical protein